VHAERLVVEFEAAIKVKHVEVVVNHLKFHGVRLLVCWLLKHRPGTWCASWFPVCLSG
jgi:hypothetical protein